MGRRDSLLPSGYFELVTQVGVRPVSKIFEPVSVFVGRYSGHSGEKPFKYRTEGTVVEGIHGTVGKTFFIGIRIRPFPNRGRAGTDGHKPGARSVGEKRLITLVAHTVFSERVHEQGNAHKPDCCAAG